MSVQECRFDVAGATIAARRWRAGAPQRVLALHGWLDNAASFDALAPLWPDTDLLAVDLPGHGYSDHKPPQASYNLWDDLLDLLRLCDQLGWERFHIVGHSRGAMMALLLAAAQPQRVLSAVFLDGLLPEPVPESDVARQLGRFLNDHLSSGGRSRRGYDTLEQAVAARCRASGMARETAGVLLSRSLEQRQGRYYWRSDIRLSGASAFKLSAGHNQGLLDSLAVPSLLLLARQGLGRHPAAEDWHSSVLTVEQLPGSHHFHLEAGAGDIADRVLTFWQSPAVCRSINKIFEGE